MPNRQFTHRKRGRQEQKTPEISSIYGRSEDISTKFRMTGTGSLFGWSEKALPESDQ